MDSYRLVSIVGLEATMPVKVGEIRTLPSEYGDSMDNTVEENSSVFSLIECAGGLKQGHVGSKTLHQQKIGLEVLAKAG